MSKKLKISDEWWTAPVEGDNGDLVIVTGRDGMHEIIQLKQFVYRVDTTWKYRDAGMPDKSTSEIMEQITDSLKTVFDKDPVAILTGIYTGAGERNWVFYTRSLHIFQKKFNEAMSQFPSLPLAFHAEEDENWSEYKEMKDLTFINSSDD